MVRPTKRRRVEYLPDVTYFKPAGIPLRDLESVSLNVEEVEAIRLKDLEGMDQEACAEKMEISRPTFQRILTSARKKIATALVEGRAIEIKGGTFRLAVDFFKCGICGYEWEAGPEEKTRLPLCPQCESRNVYGYPGHPGRHRRRGGKRHQQW